MNKILGESLVSIIVPIYNVENYLEDCLNSILSQSYSRIEIILVEDRSTDGSLLIAESYASQDSRIVLLQNASNGGLSFSRNVGISVAKGDYIVFVDSDDYVSKDYVLNLLAAALEYDVDLVLCSSYTLDDASGKIKGDNIYLNHDLYNDKGNVLSNIDLLNRYGETSLTAWSKIYKRTILMENNIRFPEGLHYEDTVFYLSYLVAVTKVAIIKQKLYYYRVNRTASITSNDSTYLDYIRIIPILHSIITSSKYYEIDTVKDAHYKIVYYFANLMYQKTHKMFPEHIQDALNFMKIIYDNAKDEELKSYAKNFMLLNKQQSAQINRSSLPLNLPLISIIVPLYNAESYIKQCVNSIMNQTYSNIEIIIIDDCSKDASYEIVDSLCKQDKRITLVKNLQNQGVSHARNVGINIAKGEYITFIDSDDYLTLYYLQDIYQAALEHSVDVVFSGGILYDNNKDAYFLHHFHSLDLFNYFNQVFDINFLLSKIDKIDTSAWGKLYKLSIIKQYEVKFAEDLSLGEDTIFFLSYIATSSKLKFFAINRNNYIYRVNMTSSLTNNKNGVRVLDTFSYIDKLISTTDYFQKEKAAISLLKSSMLMYAIFIRTKNKFYILNPDAFYKLYKFIKSYKLASEDIVANKILKQIVKKPIKTYLKYILIDHNDLGYSIKKLGRSVKDLAKIFTILLNILALMFLLVKLLWNIVGNVAKILKVLYKIIITKKR